MKYIRKLSQLLIPVMSLIAAEMTLASTDQKVIQVCLATGAGFTGYKVAASQTTDIRRPVPKTKSQTRDPSRAKMQRELKRLQKRVRELNRLRRSSKPRDRKRAKAMLPVLTKDIRRFGRKYEFAVKPTVRPKIIARSRRGHYDKLNPNEECIPLIESKTTICVLDAHASQGSNCWYDCYDKKDPEPVGVY